MTVEITDENITNANFAAELITYSISGRCYIQSGGQGDLSDIKIGVFRVINHNEAELIKETDTDSNGNYTLEGFLPCSPRPHAQFDCQYIIVPSRPGYIFNPEYKRVPLISSDITNINFACTYDPCVISGKVTFADGAVQKPLRGVKITATYGQYETRVAYTDSVGNYVLEPFGKEVEIPWRQSHHRLTGIHSILLRAWFP